MAQYDITFQKLSTTTGISVPQPITCTNTKDSGQNWIEVKEAGVFSDVPFLLSYTESVLECLGVIYTRILV